MQRRLDDRRNGRFQGSVQIDHRSIVGQNQRRSTREKAEAVIRILRGIVADEDGGCQVTASEWRWLLLTGTASGGGLEGSGGGRGTARSGRLHWTHRRTRRVELKMGASEIIVLLYNLTD